MNPIRCLWAGHGLSPKAENILLPFVKQADCILLAGYDRLKCGQVGVTRGPMMQL